MKMNSLVKVSVSAMLLGGLIGMAGCGAKQEVKPQETPVVAAATPEATPTPAPQRYSVVKGDTLWGISGKSDVYSNSFQWPLIFKANRDQIQDPDIIEVGQDLAISREFSQDDIAMAIENAKKTPRYKKHKKPRKHLPIEY